MHPLRHKIEPTMEQILAQKHLHVLEGNQQQTAQPSTNQPFCPSNIPSHNCLADEAAAAGGATISRTELDDKYQDLIAKINKSTAISQPVNQQEDGGADGQNNGLENIEE